MYQKLNQVKLSQLTTCIKKKKKVEDASIFLNAMGRYGDNICARKNTEKNAYSGCLLYK